MSTTATQFDIDTPEAWYSDAEATFGDRLAGARDAMGLSQAALAKHMGIKTRTLQAWEQDMAEPRANKLQMVSGLLNVSIPWLLTGQGEGVSAPGEDVVTDNDIRALLVELRQLRHETLKSAERMAVLEKRLGAWAQA
ncbi:MAG: helix-turn-helix transcriptional regulator [Pseudomonadota bacterium]